MTTLEIILSVIVIFLCLLYLASKVNKNKSCSEILREVKDDIEVTVESAREVIDTIKVNKLDNLIVDVIKKFILNTEKANNLKKENGQTFMTGAEKKQTVISKLTEWLEKFIGSKTTAEKYVADNLKRIEATIEDYVSFNNQMINKIKAKDINDPG